MPFHAIIPAGGAGSRLWPLSRRSNPKFLTDLTGQGRSLLQLTVDRIAPLADQTMIVCGSEHEAAVASQVPSAGIVVEPSPRGTMGAIGLAAAIIEARCGDVVVGSFAADHLITDEDAFREAVARGIESAEAGFVATIGITPDEPSTAYGYIHAGSEQGSGAYMVTSFVEKPDAATAAQYLATGEYFWNAGMFIARTSVLLDALELFHPEIAGPVRALGAAWDGPGREAAIEEHWTHLANAVIDRAIAEPLAAQHGVTVVPADMGWSDVGDYASLADVIDPTEMASQISPGGTPQPTMRIDSPDALIYTHSKPVVVVGVPEVVIVETDDVILVTQKGASQQVKTAVDSLKMAGLDMLL